MIVSEDSPLLLDDDDYLEHYGILGMKWGRRRSSKELQRARGVKSWEKRTARTINKLDIAINKNNDLENQVRNAYVKYQGKPWSLGIVVGDAREKQAKQENKIRKITSKDPAYAEYAAKRLATQMRSKNFREVEAGKYAVLTFTKRFGDQDEVFYFPRTPNLSTTRYTPKELLYDPAKEKKRK